jgi:hypothetical protein
MFPIGLGLKCFSELPTHRFDFWPAIPCFLVILQKKFVVRPFLLISIGFFAKAIESVMKEGKIKQFIIHL